MARRKRKMIEILPEQFARVRALLIKNAGITDAKVAARLPDGRALAIILNHAEHTMDKEKYFRMVRGDVLAQFDELVGTLLTSMREHLDLQIEYRREGQTFHLHVERVVDGEKRVLSVVVASEKEARRAADERKGREDTELLQ